MSRCRAIEHVEVHRISVWVTGRRRMQCQVHDRFLCAKRRHEDAGDIGWTDHTQVNHSLIVATMLFVTPQAVAGVVLVGCFRPVWRNLRYVLPVLTPRDAMWRRGGSTFAAGCLEPRSSGAAHSARPFVLATGGSPSSGDRTVSIRMPALTGGASAPRTADGWQY